MKNDGWMNLLSGFGRKNSKRPNNQFSRSADVLDQTLADSYEEDGWVARVSDIFPEDMTREWLDIHPADEEAEADIEAAEFLQEQFQTLSAPEKFRQALAFSRLFGGSLIVMGIMDGQKLDKPVRNNLQNRSIEWLKVVDRTDVELQTSKWNNDSSSSRYGQVETYRINMRTGINSQEYKMIHHTRIIPFFGRPVPALAANNVKERYWGKSAIRPLWESLADLGVTESAIGELLQESHIGKYTIDGLADMLSREEGEKEVLTRMEIMNASKSILNAVLLDTGERYEETAKSFGGVAEVLDRLMMFISGKSGIPVTRLFGRSPAGMNATGEGDMKNYYDTVRSKQLSQLMPPAQVLASRILALKGYTLDQVTMAPAPLFQLTEKEAAEVEKMKAETAGIYIDRGVIVAEEAYNKYFKG